jgi:hypothetical protein
MRFRMRSERWLIVTLVAAALLTCVTLPALRLLAPSEHPAPLWLVFLPLPIWAAVLFSTLPQYYETRADGLFLRQGWRHTLIPYTSLTELQPYSSSQSAGLFSASRMVVSTRNGQRYLIAVAEEDRFIDEVAKRCPQLERNGFGLGMRMAPY